MEGVSVDMQRSGVNKGPTTNEEFLEGEVLPPTLAREDRTRAPQNIAIRQADWLRHGGTTGCPKCIHARDNGWGKAGGAHSPACIERFRKALEAIEEGRRRVAEVDTRITSWLARQVEKADQDPTAREDDAPMRFEDFEEIEIPVQEEQSQSTPIPEASVARGVRGVIEIRADEVLTETPPRDTDEASAEAGEDDRMANYEATDAESHCPTDSDEDIGLLQPIMSLVAEDVREAIMAHDVEICKLVRELGGAKRSYARERAGAIKAMVAEIYSSPRVANCAKLLPGYRVIPGFALDLTTVNCRGEAWDFNDPAKREEARQLVAKEQPMLLVLSPTCTAFSRWQSLNAHKRNKDLVEREWSQAVVHLKFACELMKIQMSAGR